MKNIVKLGLAGLLAGAALGGFAGNAGAVAQCPQNGVHLGGNTCCALTAQGQGTAAWSCGSLRTSSAGGGGTARDMTACLMVGANAGSTRRATSTCFAGSNSFTVEDNASHNGGRPRECKLQENIQRCLGAVNFTVNGFL